MGLLGVVTAAVPIGAATTEYVVVDRNTGLAIGGFDPIAYFTNRAALPGRGEFEYRHAGAVWRFRSSGNRDAFAADPDVYMPRFGGYDPLGIGRGVPLAGHPHFWLISADRLYLFQSAQNGTIFANDRDRAVAAAEREWPMVQRKLSP